MDAHKNAAYSLVATAPSPATSGTSLIVTAGEGARFPAVPFNATIWATGAQPVWTAGAATGGNFEIVRVTAISTDTLTITRAQETTTARTVVVGDQIAATVTAKTITDIELGNLGPTGALYETYPRQIGAISGNPLTSQTVRLTAISLPKGITVTSITFYSGTTALATGVHQFFGLYDSSRNLLGTSADATSAAWAADSTKTLALTAPFVTTYAGPHYLAILVQATTMPSIQVLPSSAATIMGFAPIIVGNSSTAQTTLPNPAAAISPVGTVPIYAHVN